MSMRICIFYSWQNDYKVDCDRFIGRSIEKAIIELNRRQNKYEYYLERGGGGLVGSEDLNNHINKVINYEANIVISDFTHVGPKPKKDDKGKWIKQRALPNPNVIDETARCKEKVGASQIIRVSNSYYGDYNTNIDMYFDIRTERYPLSFNYHKLEGEESETNKNIKDSIVNSLVGSIAECTEVYIKNQKVRYAPLTPIQYVFSQKSLFKTFFKKTAKFEELLAKIESGNSFRLLALPGIGKTRMVCEAFRGVLTDVYYCDCKTNTEGSIRGAISSLLESSQEKQTIIVDNCLQKSHSSIQEEIYNHETECQLISLYYDVREMVDSDVDSLRILPQDTTEVIDSIIAEVKDIKDIDKDAIKEMASGFPLMAVMLLDQYNRTHTIASISKSDLFDRMLNINESNAEDIEKRKVFTAFSIFKYIGLFGNFAKQGRFVANNNIVTSLLHGNTEEKFQYFHNVFNEYSQGDILERSGFLVVMRPVPLAIHLAKKWYSRQSKESISTLIEQINGIDDEWTKNQLIDSLSKRIVLMADVPMAKSLIKALTDPDNTPFLNEEVLLTKLGSRLFLAFSEVNPESCSAALWKAVENKTDEEIGHIGDARRNLAWALDHLAFDKASFQDAMLTLARFSLVETEKELSNNTTGLFVARFPVLLPGTEMPLMNRLKVIATLMKDNRYTELVKKALLMGLNIHHDFRSGGAEKQGLKKLSDYVPKTYGEVIDYFRECYRLYMSMNPQGEDFEKLCETITSCSRLYYLRGFDNFLFEAIDDLSARRGYDWEGMKDAIDMLIKYDTPKRGGLRKEELVTRRNKLVKDDYVYRLLHTNKDWNYEENLSFEEVSKRKQEQYKTFAHELIDRGFYHDKSILRGILKGKCFYYHIYGRTLSEYAKEKQIQESLLISIVDIVLNDEVSSDGESLLIYYTIAIENRQLINDIYQRVESSKPRLLPALYAVKEEKENMIDQLFSFIDEGKISIKDMYGYFSFIPSQRYDVNHVADRLMDYGEEGASMVLNRCRYLFENDSISDKVTAELARKCLLNMGLSGATKDDYLFMESANNYLLKHHDEEVALHIQKITEQLVANNYNRTNYYMEKLYRSVFRAYKGLLKPRLLELLDNVKTKHAWSNLMSSSMPQEDECQDPFYEELSFDEWLEWLNEGKNYEQRVCTLASFLRYSINSEANPDMVYLLDHHFVEGIMSSLSFRLHSYGWVGSGIPLYNSRIALDKDYVAKLQNPIAKKWFEDDIPIWQNNIKEERLRDAHEWAIFDC